MNANRDNAQDTEVAVLKANLKNMEKQNEKDHKSLDGKIDGLHKSFSGKLEGLHTKMDTFIAAVDETYARVKDVDRIDKRTNAAIIAAIVGVIGFLAEGILLLMGKM